MKLFTVPNLFTLGNLLCGCLAVTFAFEGNIGWSVYLVGIAAVLDFLDGFVARALKQHSPVGKDLDSLADMVTFGVVPGVVMYKMLGAAFAVYYPDANSLAQSGTGPFGNLWTTFNANAPKELTWMDFAPFIAFLIPLFSALRLAKFNNDKRQTDSFIGVPTPANSILICSFVLILRFSRLWVADWPADIGGAPGPSYARKIFNLFMQSPPANAGLRVNGGWAPGVSFAESLLLNPWFLVAVTLVMSFLLVAEIPLFALKFKNFGWKGNEVRYLFLILSVALAALLQFTGVPLVIVLYVLLSVVNNAMKKKSGGAPGGAETPGS